MEDNQESGDNIISKELKSIPPLFSQVILRNLGAYCSSYMGNDIYFLMESVHTLMAIYGEETLKQIYIEKGVDWVLIKKKIDYIDKKVMAIKNSYDFLEDKTFKHKDKEKELKKLFLKNSSKIAILQPEIYDLFVTLVVNSTIQRQQIPSEAFKVLEHLGYRKFDIDKRRSQTGQQNIIQQT